MAPDVYPERGKDAEKKTGSEKYPAHNLLRKILDCEVLMAAFQKKGRFVL
jgi:hypothetical protein